MSQPSDKIFSNGISVTQWTNSNQEGRTWNTFTVQKSYKDSNNQWQNTNSLNTLDLLVVADLCREMYSRNIRSANVTQGAPASSPAPNNGYAQPAATSTPPGQAAGSTPPPPPNDDPNCPF